MSWDAASPTPTDYRVTGPNPTKTTIMEGRRGTRLSSRGQPQPQPSRTSATTLSTRSGCAPATIKANTKAILGWPMGHCHHHGGWRTSGVRGSAHPEPAEEEPAEEDPVQQPPRDDPAQQAPPAAPFIGAIAVTPDEDVLISWFNLNEDDSITGYQILRGPDAENLVVIEDDTESNSTSYTDTAPPAGQTHTYGVKARNATGLSPAGTATATVPAAEEEEVLITAQHGSTDDTLVTNLGQTPTTQGANLTGLYDFATSFETGDNPFGYHVTSVQVYLRLNLNLENPTPIPAPELSILSDGIRVFPGETVLHTFTTSSAVTNT